MPEDTTEKIETDCQEYIIPKETPSGIPEGTHQIFGEGSATGISEEMSGDYPIRNPIPIYRRKCRKNIRKQVQMKSKVEFLEESQTEHL